MTRSPSVAPIPSTPAATDRGRRLGVVALPLVAAIVVAGTLARPSARGDGRSASAVPIADSGLSGEETRRIDSTVAAIVAASGVPGAVVAVVTHARLAYRHGYGLARLSPRLAATPAMRYAIGSVSKQFTAAAILLLAQDGRLSLDDPVSRFLPALTRSRDVTIRQLLSHTSGYQDYWPQDYVMATMRVPTTADAILSTWATKPLDFEPGTAWQYSNTNYVIAGQIIERASGMPFMTFLQQRILAPLGMAGIADVNLDRLGETDATGYYRRALAPLRPAPKEGRGWLFAAGELAMPIADLAKWDISLIDRSLLAPASYDALTHEVPLANGSPTHYALGIDVNVVRGRLVWSHTGEVSGFTTSNVVYPTDSVAVIVYVNQDASGAATEISQAVGRIVLPPPATASAAAPAPDGTAAARAVFVALQHGQLDRAQFTDNANIYFDDSAIHDYESSLGPLGAPRQFCQVATEARGGMVFHAYVATFPARALVVTTYVTPDGKLEQYLVAAARQGSGAACTS
jgi:CubicO group peptidase (beta-lactamase class C family)